MATNFDPSTHEADKSFQGSSQHKKLSNKSLFHRPSYNSIWKRSTSSDVGSQINSFNGQEIQTGQSTNSPDANIFESPPLPLPSPTSTTVTYQVTAESEQRRINIVEQKPKPYWESGESSFDDWNQDQSEGANYATKQASSYNQEEYYGYGKTYKKKGLSNRIDRLVQRIPALGKLYKQAPSSFDKSDQVSDFDYGNQLPRELTADELALNARYSDKTRMEFIKLQVNDQTQPVDVSIHHDTNKIYLCDIGRSVVEIYNMDKTFEHAINDAKMIKFQPTAIAVAFDGTIIVASHFNHCLYMYSPASPLSESNCYSYKQFKLGVEGAQIHQFYQPAGISVDGNDGYLYVCDRGNNRIQVFTPDGICERLIELFSDSKKKYRLDPIRIALQKNSDQIVCVVGLGDTLCFIPKYTNGRTTVEPFYIFDENGLGLDNAAGLAVDDHDRIFISDTNHNRIVICTSEGNYITSFGTEGDELGQLKRPCGLDVTKDGTLVVTDPGNKRLQLFGLLNKKSSTQDDPPKEQSHDTNNLPTATEPEPASMF